MKNKFDYIIIISSFNRNNILKTVINKINENNSSSYLIILYNDGNNINDFNKIFKDNNNLKIIHGKQNNGKFFYWKSIDILLKEVFKYEYKYLIQLDDDHYVTTSFFDKIENIYSDISKSYIIKAVINNNYESERWGLEHWVDGGSIYPKIVFDKIGYNILEIPLNRWKKNTYLSSGVWRQVSKRINKHKFKTFTPDISLAKHLCETDSIMNTELRKKEPLITKNYF